MVACFVAFILSCLLLLFLVSCVPHKLEPPENPPATPLTGGGKIDGPKKPAGIKEEVEKGLANLYLYIFTDSTVPLEWVWKNIAYKSFDYKTFFAAACPSGWVKGASWLNCNETGENFTKKFSVSAHDAVLVVEIENLSFANSFFSRKIESRWEIRGDENDFTVLKYEKITSDSVWIEYSKIETRFIRSQNKIIASGKIGSRASGVFYFETRELIFPPGAKNPAGGKIFFYGENDIWADFDEAKKYNGCVPVMLYYRLGKYAYCGPWPLQDLFDYLKMFIQ